MFVLRLYYLIANLDFVLDVFFISLGKVVGCYCYKICRAILKHANPFEYDMQNMNGRLIVFNGCFVHKIWVTSLPLHLRTHNLNKYTKIAWVEKYKWHN